MATIRYKMDNLDAAGQIAITSRGLLIANTLPPVHDLEIPPSDRGHALSGPLSYEPKGLFFELPLIVGSERRAYALASVRRSNCTCGFPACSFHEDSATPRCKRRN
jgi:hypothetical protein